LALSHFLLFAGYAIVFFLARGIVRKTLDTPWLAMLPIMGIAAWQGVLGLSQFLSPRAPPAHGSYAIRNHFAGMLAMSLPFALAFAGAALTSRPLRGPLPAGLALRAGVGLAAAALIGVGILASLSRGGLAACAASILVMAILESSAWLRGKRKWPILLALGLVAVLALAVLAPAQLTERLTNVTFEGRVEVWHDTLHLIAAYPIFGTGLGGYVSAFEKFKTSEFEYVQDYAHNDYLQFLAELGVIGFAIAAALLLTALNRAVRTSQQSPDPGIHWLAVACGGALAAILVHSTVDFNLYVPANATLLAWICGITAGGLVDPGEGHVVQPDCPSDLPIQAQ